MPGSVRDFCLHILESGDLESKLAAPSGALSRVTSARRAPLRLSRPARVPELAMGPGAGPLPRPHALREEDARRRCLARFAHHELMAVELFAWALLRWPTLPEPLGRDLLAILRDEQRHCRLYLERLRAMGSDLSDHAPHSDYFWKHTPALSDSPHGVHAFLAAMGLTLEQANLDFSLLYRDAFREAGDEASAAVCQRVHDDELRHVGLAARWLQALRPPGESLIDSYLRVVPFPLSASRAKGRRFDAAARRAAGLPESFIDYVRSARPSQETGGSARRSHTTGAG